MIDLHEGVAAIFEEANAESRMDYDELRFDNETASNLTYEASWLAQARLAEGVRRWRCENCGGEIELRPGCACAIHLGPPAELPLGCRRVMTLNETR